MRNWGSTIVRILLLCLVVGLVISVFGISPEGILSLLGTTAERIFLTVAGVVQWAVPYMLIGAVVVIPIWVVVYIHFLRERVGVNKPIAGETEAHHKLRLTKARADMAELESAEVTGELVPLEKAEAA